MKRLLYIETNFAIGIAKGQDPDGADFLESIPSDICLVFPGVCFMESFSNLSNEIAKRNVFYDGMRKHAEDVKRDQRSDTAASLAVDLESSILKGNSLLQEIESRLRDALGRISKEAGEIIGADNEIIQECLSKEYLKDPTDNLILCSILWHARRNPQDAKAFLSRNSKDFEQTEVIHPLNSAGVKYFTSLLSATGWLRAQVPSASG